MSVQKSPQRLSGLSRIAAFFQTEVAGGLVLLLAAALALIVANTGLYESYHYVFESLRLSLTLPMPQGAELVLDKTLLHWINDGLMAIFFLLIGLEIKRELVDGELSTRDRAILPFLGAIGGMAVPAAIYWFVNRDVPANLPGWAISSATDIAFAICMVALVGSRVPVSLKILLMAIAVIDDLGAILIIALFYAHGFNLMPLVCAAVALAALFALNRLKVRALFPYLVIGALLWLAVLQSGIHATLAGVLTAFFIPMRGSDKIEHSPALRLEHSLLPWISFLILPIFGFANAGVPFAGMTLGSLTDPLTLGIILGLVIGKPLGIFTILVLAIRTGISPMPLHANWLQMLGISVLCGIGFTMSLFIGGLAFTHVEQQAEIRLGVLGGSLLSALIGFMLLRFIAPASPKIILPQDGGTGSDMV